MMVNLLDDMMGKIDKFCLAHKEPPNKREFQYSKLAVAYVKGAFIFQNTWPVIYFFLKVGCEFVSSYQISGRGRRGRNRMVVGFTTTYAISVYHTNVGSSNPVQARCTRYNIM